MDALAFRYNAAAAAVSAALRRMVLALKYAEDQPRVPAGSPDGGQWTSGGGVAHRRCLSR